MDSQSESAFNGSGCVLLEQGAIEIPLGKQTVWISRR
jgi:hypothetical protein